MASAHGDAGSWSQAARDEVVAWVRANAQVIETVEPGGSLVDVEPLARWMDGATVVGLGESVRGVRSGRQLYQVKHRLARLLVERLGFRVIALEDTAAVGELLDRHVRSGDGALFDVLASAWWPWRTAEFAELVRWVRSYNVAHGDDPVGFVGIDGAESAALARNTLAARAETGRRIVYWGGMAHVAVHGPADSTAGDASAGRLMRQHLGDGYVAVGVTCHHGVGADVLPPPPDEFAESVLGAVGIECYALDLRTVPASGAVRSWLTTPTATRVIGPRYDPADDAGFALRNGTLAGWFDLLVHIRSITRARPTP